MVTKDEKDRSSEEEALPRPAPPPDEAPPQSMEGKRDRERILRSRKTSCLPTAVFLSLHAALLFLGIVYLVPWIRGKLHKAVPVDPAPVHAPPTHVVKKAVDPSPPPQPPVPEAVPPPEVVVPFPPPAVTGEIEKLIAAAREGITGKLRKVNRGGSDYGTLKDAIEAADDGDIIEITDSATYGEIVHIKNKRNLLIRAAKDAKPVIDAQLAKSSYCILIEGSPGTIVSGLTCLRARDTAIAVRPKSERTILAENVCEHSNFGIRVTSPDTTVVANVCRNNDAVGFALEQAEGSLIVDNVASGDQRGGIKVARSPRTLIVNNIVHRVGEHGIVVSRSDDCSILHNTVAEVAKHPFRVEQSDGVTVMNNIGTRGSKAAISFDPTVKEAVCDYNLFHETHSYGEWQAKPYSVLETWQAGTGHDEHSMVAEPLFVNPDVDLRLRPNSPAKGRANDGGDLGASWEQSGLTFLEKMLSPKK